MEGLTPEHLRDQQLHMNAGVFLYDLLIPLIGQYGLSVCLFLLGASHYVKIL